MPLDATRMTLNGHLIHQDVRQFVELLTGVMSDQLVSISNSVIATGLLRGSQLQSTSGDVLMGNPGMGMYTFGGNDIYANTNNGFLVRSNSDGHLAFSVSVADNTSRAYGRLVTNNWDSGWSNNLGGNTICQGNVEVLGAFAGPPHNNPAMQTWILGTDVPGHNAVWFPVTDLLNHMRRELRLLDDRVSYLEGEGH